METHDTLTILARSMEALASALNERTCWYALFSPNLLDSTFHTCRKKFMQSIIPADTMAAAIERMGCIQRPDHMQLTLADVLHCLNKWVPYSAKASPISVDCFIVNLPLPGGLTYDIAGMAVGQSAAPGNSNPFVVNERGFEMLLSAADSIYSIKAVTLQLYGTGDTICSRTDCLEFMLTDVLAPVLGVHPSSDSFGAMTSIIPMLREGTSLMIPVWSNYRIACRQGRVSPAITPTNDRTMFISLARLCGIGARGHPYLYVSPLTCRNVRLDEIRHRAGEGIRTETLREIPVFPEVLPLTNVGGCISFGHIGTAPVYIGFGDGKSTLTVYGHIHAGRFRELPRWNGLGSPFSVAARTITPCAITPETVLEWAGRLPGPPYPKKDREKAKAAIQASIEETGLRSVPKLPKQMYGPRFDVSDAAIVEAAHVWAAFLRSAGTRQLPSGHIRGSLDPDGTLILAIPDTSAREDGPPMQLGNIGFYGGIVVISPDGDHAKCALLQEDGSLIDSVGPMQPSPRMRALIDSVAAAIILHGRNVFADTSDRISIEGVGTFASLSLPALAHFLHVGIIDMCTEMLAVRAMIAKAAGIHGRFFSAGYHRAWLDVVSDKQSIRSLFCELRN